MRLIEPQTGRQTLAEQAYDSLRDSIISLKLQPGQMVYEADSAQLLGMSRTPVREAFKMLLMEDLIEVLPQRGARIALISQQKVEETRFVRASLEVSAFRKAAREWKQGEQHYHHIEQQIERVLEEQKRAAGDMDIMLFLHWDEAFHRLIISQAHNPTLMKVIYHMRGHLNRLRYLMLKELNLINDIIKEHETLFQATRTNNESETIRLLEQHLSKMSEELPIISAKFPHYFRE
ncbi:MAG TPA: GntR family transcriptional regulator [Bacilli bacterium]